MGTTTGGRGLDEGGRAAMDGPAGPAPLDGSPSAAEVSHPLAPVARERVRLAARADLVTAGKVLVLSLDAVARRFGSRWPRRREGVHAHVGAVLERQLGPSASHLRLSETEMLVCQPALGRAPGQAQALGALREILSHFIGDPSPAERGLQEVVAVDEAGMRLRPVDGRVVAAAIRGLSPRALADLAEAENVELGRASHWTPFATADGLAIGVDPNLEQVVRLGSGEELAWRLSARVLDLGSGGPLRPYDAARLAGPDRVRLDVAGLLAALEALERTDARPATLIAPVALASLATAEGRARMVAGLKAAARRAEAGVICELYGLDGAAPAQVIEAVGIVRGFSRLVFGRLEEMSSSTTRPLAGLGLNGLAARAPARLVSGDFIGWAATALLGARTVTETTLFYGLGSEAAGRLAMNLGATHASFAR